MRASHPNSQLATHQLPLRAAKVQVQISDPIVGRHLQLLKRVLDQDAGGAGLLPGYGEAVFVVDREPDVLAVPDAAWAGRTQGTAPFVRRRGEPPLGISGGLDLVWLFWLGADPNLLPS